MVRNALLVAVLLLLASCSGLDGSATEPTETPSPSARLTNTDTATDKPAVSASLATERAIHAEQERIETLLESRENITGVLFGNLRPAEAEIIERNASGVAVETVVGYSFGSTETARLTAGRRKQRTSWTTRSPTSSLSSRT